VSAALSPRRWVCPGGARLDLAHLTNTTGGRRDGYHLIVTHPGGVLVNMIPLGATVPEADLADALAAVEAVRVDDLPCPTLPEMMP
jgi:hypothetical protein